MQCGQACAVGNIDICSGIDEQKRHFVLIVKAA